jgi:hypothetical protein
MRVHVYHGKKRQLQLCEECAGEKPVTEMEAMLAEVGAAEPHEGPYTTSVGEVTCEICGYDERLAWASEASKWRKRCVVAMFLTASLLLLLLITAG